MSFFVDFVDLLVDFMSTLSPNDPMRATPVMPTTVTMTMTTEHNDSSAVPVMVVATVGTHVTAVNPGHDVSAAMMAIAIIVIADRQTIEPAARANNSKDSNCK